MTGETNIYTLSDSGVLFTDFKRDFLDIDDPYMVAVFNEYSPDITGSYFLITTGYVTLKEGHTIMIANKKLKDLSFDMTDDGRLIVVADDADKYSIGIGDNGDDGHLLYNYEETGIPEMIIGNTFIVR